MVFHAVGDTVRVSGTAIQEALAAVTEKQIEDARAAHRQAEEPLFFYHLGSVVLFNGLSTDYPAQFYRPYQHYDAPIFAIARSHDGDTMTTRGAVPSKVDSLLIDDAQAIRASVRRDSPQTTESIGVVIADLEPAELHVKNLHTPEKGIGLETVSLTIAG
jgi:hypothetical protein